MDDQKPNAYRFNCSNSLAEDTIIGSHNLLTPQCHVGHNCVIGDHVSVGSGAMLAGHVVVADRVFISGNCLVYQFCRIGTLAMMQGGSGINKDLPPFTVARPINEICGLNTVGLRCAGFRPKERWNSNGFTALFLGDPVICPRPLSTRRRNSRAPLPG